MTIIARTMRWVGVAIAVVATFLIAACASPVSITSNSGNKNDFYREGRLALKIYTDPIETFSADFELTGNPQTGTLTFSTALGVTAAQLEWGAQGAKLRARGEVRDFESLDDLTQYAVGSKLPIGSLFAWLQGENALAAGWTVDLERVASGRLSARRLPPEIPVDLKMSWER